MQSVSAAPCVKPTSFHFSRLLLDGTVRSDVAQKYIDSKCASVVLCCLPLGFPELCGLTCWSLDGWMVASSEGSVPAAQEPLCHQLGCERSHPYCHILLASPLLGSSQGAGLEGGCTGFPYLAGETLVVLNSCLCRNKGGSGGDGVLHEETEYVHDSPWGQRMLGRRDELPQYICIPRNCLNISSLPCCVTLFQKLLLFLVAF